VEAKEAHVIEAIDCVELATVPEMETAPGDRAIAPEQLSFAGETMLPEAEVVTFAPLEAPPPDIIAAVALL
jgi:hypothetical protein